MTVVARCGTRNDHILPSSQSTVHTEDTWWRSIPSVWSSLQIQTPVAIGTAGKYLVRLFPDRERASERSLEDHGGSFTEAQPSPAPNLLCRCTQLIMDFIDADQTTTTISTVFDKGKSYLSLPVKAYRPNTQGWWDGPSHLIYCTYVLHISRFWEPSRWDLVFDFQFFFLLIFCSFYFLFLFINFKKCSDFFKECNCFWIFLKNVRIF